MPNQLKIIKAPILSLVRNPANKKWWYVTKEAAMEDLIERIENILPAGEDFEDLGEEDLEEEVKNAVETLEDWDEELPDEAKKAAGVLLRTSVLSDEEEDDVELEDEMKNTFDRLADTLDRIDEHLVDESDEGEKQDDPELGELVEAIADLIDAPTSDVWEALGDLLPEDYGYPEPEDKDDDGEEEPEEDEQKSEEDDDGEEDAGIDLEKDEAKKLE